MASTGEKPLGITAPLSTALPTDSENQASSALIEELKRQNNYESVVDTQKRTEALKALQAITEEFIKQVSKAQGLPDSVANSAGGKIFTYGSFRLGVFGPGSDIDTLVVGPKHVTRDDFFKYFPDLLVKMSPPGAITDLTPVVDSFVPIIKFEYEGISIDLIFSRIAVLNQIPQSLSLQDSNLLRGLDEADLRSLNGTRVTDAILDLVPQKTIFRTALRGIKLWAQRRAIYANIIGFPGGVAWAMLVARVCQLYPKATSSTVVLKFFRIMEKWQWPTPVLLTHIASGPLQVKVWNPRIYKHDSFHLMPIITPAYPSMCATHNITRSTKEIIQRELKRGGNITDQIMSGKLQWKDLFAKHTFFTEGYKYYLSVISASTTREAQNIWGGLVESKIRLLVLSLEGHDSISLAHPFNKGSERVHECHSEEEVEKAKSGSLQFLVKGEPTASEKPDDKPKQESANDVKKENGEDVKKENDEDVKEKNGDDVKKEDEPKTTMVYTTTFYIGLELKEGARSLDLSYQVDDFKYRCTSWDKHDDSLNALNIVHTRNCDLPDDVFAPGEVKPTRPVKKKTVVKKRTVAEEPNGAAPPPKRQQTSVAAQG
ncbi:hypothetical protein V491_08169 [Pseudogymnoascus sp. VKM F-3775]|nr:hypothetical protein V491_08169 [Pseudogymnoascus sp. VKM F-3775]